MTSENKKLTEFTSTDSHETIENSQNNKKQSDTGKNLNNSNDRTETTTDSSNVCDCYHEMENEYQERINELGITPPKCGHCIAYLCNNVSAGSASVYNSSLRFFIQQIHQQGVCINNVEYTDVRKHFEKRGKQELAKSTIIRDKSAIKGAISRFEAENKKFPNVSWKISNNIDPSDYSVGTKFERSGLNDEEISQLLAVLNDLRNKLMTITSIETGPRATATTLIKISDVDLEKKEIELKNTKSGGTYIMPLTDDLAALLEHWIQNIRSSYIMHEDKSYLFPSRAGGKLSTRQYELIIHTAAKEAGIQEKIGKIPLTGKQKKNLNCDYRTKWKVDIHTLRHTFSKLLKNNEVSKKAREYALDHSRDVTDGYGIDEEACRDEIRNKFDGINLSNL